MQSRAFIQPLIRGVEVQRALKKDRNSCTTHVHDDHKGERLPANGSCRPFRQLTAPLSESYT